MGILQNLTSLIFKRGESMLTDKEHSVMCENVQLNMQIQYRDFIDKKIDKLEGNLKEHIDKAVNGNGAKPTAS